LRTVESPDTISLARTKTAWLLETNLMISPIPKTAITVGLLFAGCLMIGPGTSYAQAQTEQDNVTLTAVGVQSNYGYITISVPLTLTICPYGTLYMDLTTPGGQAAYTLAVTARSAGRPLVRLTYAYNATTGSCMVGLLQM
jgi:hypothetical protein